MNLLEQNYTDETRKELVKLETMASNLAEFIGQMRWHLDQVVYCRSKGLCPHCGINHQVVAEKMMTRSIGLYNQIKAIMEVGEYDSKSSTSVQRSIA